MTTHTHENYNFIINFFTKKHHDYMFILHVLPYKKKQHINYQKKHFFISTEKFPYLFLHKTYKTITKPNQQCAKT